METDDVLSDQVQIRRPVFAVLICGFPVRIIADPRDIVGQCIKPYINHVLVVKIYRNAPFETRPGYTQILKTRQQEIVHHFILAGHGLYKFGMRIDMFDQAIGIFAHLEEICIYHRISAKGHTAPGSVLPHRQHMPWV